MYHFLLLTRWRPLEKKASGYTFLLALATGRTEVTCQRSSHRISSYLILIPLPYSPERSWDTDGQR